MAIHECEELKKRGTGLTEWLFTTPKNEDSIDWSLRITLFYDCSLGLGCAPYADTYAP
jgi:hypothetical protein